VARAGDQLVVWPLDRLGRSMSDLIVLIRSLQDRGVELRSLTEGIDVAVRSGVAPGDRSEHPESADALRAQLRLALPQTVQHLAKLGGASFRLLEEAFDQTANQILQLFATLRRDRLHAVSNLFGNPDGKVSHCWSTPRQRRTSFWPSVRFFSNRAVTPQSPFRTQPPPRHRR
jgi:hypothetical protein